MRLEIPPSSTRVERVARVFTAVERHKGGSNFGCVRTTLRPTNMKQSCDALTGT
jgi:hypothetical protein